jgi:hypothetical protein
MYEYFIYVPFFVIDGVLPCTDIKIAKQSMQALFIGTNPNCCIFVGVRVLAEQGAWRDTAFPAIYYRLFLRL